MTNLLSECSKILCIYPFIFMSIYLSIEGGMGEGRGPRPFKTFRRGGAAPLNFLLLVDKKYPLKRPLTKMTFFEGPNCMGYIFCAMKTSFSLGGGRYGGQVPLNPPNLPPAIYLSIYAGLLS